MVFSSKKKDRYWPGNRECWAIHLGWRIRVRSTITYQMEQERGSSQGNPLGQWISACIPTYQWKNHSPRANKLKKQKRSINLNQNCLPRSQNILNTTDTTGHFCPCPVSCPLNQNASAMPFHF